MTPEKIPMTLVAILYGIVIGSFLNVCIYRIPLKKSIAREHSHCMCCGYQLKWYDLIPLFSWLMLRGRCRNCKAPISVQYPIVEAANGILYGIMFFINDYNTFNITVLYCLMTSALLVLSVIDFRTYEIPFGINVFILVLGLVRLGMDYHNWFTYVIGFFAISVLLEILLLLSKGRAIGGGDVKLMAAAGLLIGWRQIILAFILACIIGSVIHGIRMKVSRADHVLAMGPYLSAGIFLSAVWGEAWIRAYISLFKIT